MTIILNLLKLFIFCNTIYPVNKNYPRPTVFLSIYFFCSYCQTRPVFDWFHDSSIPSRKCAKSSESVLKPEKFWIIAIFAVQMLFFGVQNKNILSAQYKLLPPYGTCFVTFLHKFCCFMTQVLPPYDLSFAALWPSTNKQSTVQKYVAFSRGGRVCV